MSVSKKPSPVGEGGPLAVDEVFVIHRTKPLVSNLKLTPHPPYFFRHLLPQEKALAQVGSVLVHSARAEYCRARR